MILALEEVKVAFGAQPVLKGVSLALDYGEIYVLLGRNGAGKSTTIRAALGLVPVWAGAVRLFGRDPHACSGALRSRVGVLSEHCNLPSWMSGEQYLAHFASLHRTRMLPGEISERLSRVGLEATAGHAIATYSRAMMRKLGLAQALICNPPLLMLDEPTDGLASRDREEIHDILSVLAGGKTAILLCTQNPDDVERLAIRVGVIDGGRTVLDGRVGELLAQRSSKLAYRLRLTGQIPASASDGASPARLIAYDGTWASVEIDAGASPVSVWRELVFRGWPIAEIIRTGGGLDKLFCELTAPPDPHHRRAA